MRFRFGQPQTLDPTIPATFATGSPPTAWMLAPGRCPSYFRGEITTVSTLNHCEDSPSNRTA